MGSPLSGPDKALKAISALLARTPQVKFAYIFGSRARGDAGPLSDIDVAVYLDPACSPLDYRLRLMEELARALGSERFDLVTLNDSSPVLKYEVVREGRVVKEDKESRVEFEARSLGEYFDTEYLRKEQRAYLKEQLTCGDAHGQ